MLECEFDERALVILGFSGAKAQNRAFGVYADRSILGSLSAAATIGNHSKDYHGVYPRLLKCDGASCLGLYDVLSTAISPSNLHLSVRGDGVFEVELRESPLTVISLAGSPATASNNRSGAPTLIEQLVGKSSTAFKSC
jgi:hypothetical protein